MQPLLVCPGCRTLTGDQLDLRTVDRAGDVLSCECGRRYPIIDGVPILLADPSSFFRTEMHAVVERDLPLEAAALLVEHGSDDAPYARLLEHLSIYTDAHWGDRAMPPAGFAGRSVLDRIATLPHVEAAVELGCSMGRVVAELARTADHVVGVDLHFGSLRRARRLLAGESVPYLRRTYGRNYAHVGAHAGDLVTDRVQLVCGDATNPPLVPSMYDRVVALNLLDAVHRPSVLLDVLNGLCAPGGEVLLCTPYAWQSGIVADDSRLGGAAPELAVTTYFTEKGYKIADQADLPWSLRRDSRSTVTYQIHYLRVRKPVGPQTV